MSKDIYIVTGNEGFPTHRFKAGTEVKRVAGPKAFLTSGVHRYVTVGEPEEYQYIHQDNVKLKEPFKEQVAFIESKPHAHREVKVIRERLTIEHVNVGESFTLHGRPAEVYVKISNSHVFNHSHLQMHTTSAKRFVENHLNLVTTELRVFNGK